MNDPKIPPPAPEPPPRPYAAISNHGNVTRHETPEAAEKAQGAQHRAANARHHRSVGRTANAGKKSR